MASWRGQQGTPTERGYGWDWQKLRLTILQRDSYLCQACLTLGRPTPATDVDHITPKVQGGTDDADNLRSLCRACHQAKSQREKPKQESDGKLRRSDGWGDRSQTRYGYTIPHGVNTSAIPVVLVCGPPASGKTTYIANHAQPGDMVIDFDAYLHRIGGQSWDTDKAKVKLAFALRNADIRSLEYRTSGTAWIIKGAPTAQEHEAWRQALGPKLTVVMLDVPATTCIARVEADTSRSHASEAMRRVIGEWWAAHDAGKT